MRSGALVLLMLTAALTGCLGSEDPAPEGEDLPEPVPLFDPVWHEVALASGSGHDHTDLSHHANATTPNFVTLGHDPLVTDADGSSPGGSSCGDAAVLEDGTRLGVVKAADSRGVVLTDLTDPTEPGYLGELFLTATHIYDVALVPTGEHIALVTAHPKDSPPPSPAGLEAQWRHACEQRAPQPDRAQQQGVQDPVPRPTSLVLVDISDPSEAQVVDQRPITGLGHGIFSTLVDGTPWVLAVTESISQGTKHFHLYQLTDGPLGPSLEPLSVYAAQPRADHATGVAGHSDGWIHEHPLTGQVLGYFAAGTALEIVDLSDPRQPVPLGSWTDIRGEAPVDHNIHSVHAFRAPWNGSHYTVVGPELGGPPSNSAPTGTVWVLDTTDPSDPHEVAAWTLPTEVAWEGSLQFSPHYLTVHDGTLFVSMYHGGIWAVELAGVPEGNPEQPTLLESIGVYVPTSAEAPAPEGYGFSWTPNLEEVFVIDDEGTLVTFDSNSGVHTFRFDASRPAPAPIPWPLDPLPPSQDPIVGG